MNPELNSECTNLLAGFAYCVATVDGASTSVTPTTSSVVTPTPTQDGMTKNCDKFYKVKSGDGCYDIANNNGVTLDDFYSYNPAVGDDCSKLYPDFYVCVGATEPCSIEVAFKTVSCTSNDVSFEVLEATAYGEAVYVVGSVPELGAWSTDGAKALSADGYTDEHPSWTGTISIALGQDVEYKFVKIGLDGSFTWEADPNRHFSVPASCDAAGPTQSGVWQ